MKKVLFVCLGNICRSPTAEGIMKHLIDQKDLSDRIYCDSAGTSSVHKGERPDPRSSAYALSRGVVLDSRSRPFDKVRDFDEFDLILAMDKNNLKSLQSLDLTGAHKDKIKLMCEFFPGKSYEEVPDPYFSGDEGFEVVFDILEEATKGLLNFLVKDFK